MTGTTSENSWYVIRCNSQVIHALSSQSYANGGAIDVQTLCVMNGCYSV